MQHFIQQAWGVSDYCPIILCVNFSANFSNYMSKSSGKRVMSLDEGFVLKEKYKALKGKLRE